MRFSPSRFNRHLANMGQQLLWRRSYGCACVNPDSGAPDPKHALCGGKGRIWDQGIPMVCGVTKQFVTQEMVDSGVFDAGDLTVTVPESTPMWDLAGRFDRIVLLNSTDVFSQPLRRGHVSERLLFPVEKVTRCFWLSQTTRQIVDGSLPVVAADGTLSWPNGGEPPMGFTYSLTGTRYDEYFVFDQLPSDRNEHSGMRLPKRMQLRKWDMFGR